MTTRRKLFKRSVQGALLGLGAPRIAFGSTESQHNLIWITCFGGWDATRALIPAFDSPLVNLEGVAEPMEFGSLRLVDHPGRPSVREFFQYSEMARVHGVLTPSVAHEACLQLIRTGVASGQPDWRTLLASELLRFPIPHMVLSGEFFLERGRMVARTGSGAVEVFVECFTVKLIRHVCVLWDGPIENSRITMRSATEATRRTNNQDPMAIDA